MLITDEIPCGLTRMVLQAGKGPVVREVVLHAGSVNGWVAGAELVFRAKSSSGDYHNEMNI